MKIATLIMIAFLLLIVVVNAIVFQMLWFRYLDQSAHDLKNIDKE